MVDGTIPERTSLDCDPFYSCLHIGYEIKVISSELNVIIAFSFEPAVLLALLVNRSGDGSHVRAQLSTLMYQHV